MSYILPYEETTTKTIVSFELYISELNFNTFATFRVSTYDINRVCISNTYVKLEGQDYLNWGNDDDYVIQFVAMKLGFILVASPLN